MISVVCLPKMRQADARAAFLRGNRFPAVEAVRMGLINEAVPADHLDTAVDAVIADVLSCAPGALATAKQLLAQVQTMPTEEAFSWTSELSANLFRGDEAKEGTQAFLDKRPPSWTL